jgi:hypothetical protein
MPYRARNAISCATKRELRQVNKALNASEPMRCQGCELRVWRRSQYIMNILNVPRAVEPVVFECVRSQILDKYPTVDALVTKVIELGDMVDIVGRGHGARKRRCLQ